MKAIQINRAFGLGLIAQDGVLASSRAEFEWRNRRVRRTKRNLAHAQAQAMQRQIDYAYSLVNIIAAENWPGASFAPWPTLDEIHLSRDVYPDGSVGSIKVEASCPSSYASPIPMDAPNSLSSSMSLPALKSSPMWKRGDSIMFTSPTLAPKLHTYLRVLKSRLKDGITEIVDAELIRVEVCDAECESRGHLL